MGDGGRGASTGGDGGAAISAGAGARKGVGRIPPGDAIVFNGLKASGCVAASRGRGRERFLYASLVGEISGEISDRGGAGGDSTPWTMGWSAGAKTRENP